MKIGIATSGLLLAINSMSPAQNTTAQNLPEQNTTAQNSPAPVSSPGPNPSSGFGLPTGDGTVHYALNAAQLIRFGFYNAGAVTPSTSLSGDVSYSSTSQEAPFTMLFAGGLLISESSNVGTQTFLNLMVSQQLIKQKWILGISDGVSYLPESPTTGLSGIAGVGDIGAYPIDGPALGPAGGVLTESGSRVSNGISGSAERLITASTSIRGSGSWEILHFLNGSDGYDSSRILGDVSVNHSIDARDSVSVSGIYSVFDYGASQDYLSFNTRAVNGTYSRLLSRSMSVLLSAGPEWIVSSNQAAIESRVITAGNIALSYDRGLTQWRIGYSRGINNGSGVLAGALSDSVLGEVSHSIERDWLISASGSYVHTSGLANITPPGGGEPAPLSSSAAFSTFFGGVQATHRLGRRASCYLSYSLQHQSHNAAYTGTNAYSGTSQTIGIGISFTPRSTRLGEF